MIAAVLGYFLLNESAHCNRVVITYWVTFYVKHVKSLIMNVSFYLFNSRKFYKRIFRWKALKVFLTFMNLEISNLLHTSVVFVVALLSVIKRNCFLLCQFCSVFSKYWKGFSQINYLSLMRITFTNNFDKLIYQMQNILTTLKR